MISVKVAMKTFCRMFKFDLLLRPYGVILIFVRTIFSRDSNTISWSLLSTKTKFLHWDNAGKTA